MIDHWAEFRFVAAETHQANKTLHIVVMAEPSVETAALTDVFDLASPNYSTIFDCTDSAQLACRSVRSCTICP